MAHGKVKMTISEYDEIMNRLRSAEVKAIAHDAMIDELTNLVIEEMAVQMESSYKWAEPAHLEISDVADAIGMNWKKMLEKWKEERKSKMEEIINE